MRNALLAKPEDCFQRVRCRVLTLVEHAIHIKEWCCHHVPQASQPGGSVRLEYGASQANSHPSPAGLPSRPRIVAANATISPVISSVSTPMPHRPRKSMAAADGNAPVTPTGPESAPAPKGPFGLGTEEEQSCRRTDATNPLCRGFTRTFQERNRAPSKEFDTCPRRGATFAAAFACSLRWAAGAGCDRSGASASAISPVGGNRPSLFVAPAERARRTREQGPSRRPARGR
jgi:hypothetical protein